MFETLLGWDVIGWVIAFLIPGGLGVLALNEFWAAKCCFALSAIVLGSKTFMWGVTTNQPIEMRSIIIVAAFGIIGLATVESFRWIDRKQMASIPAPTPPPPPTSASLPTTSHPTEPAQASMPAHKKPSPPKPDLRELTLRFVYPEEPCLLIVNSTDLIVRDIKWMVFLWNIDLPDRNDPLPIPVAAFDWLRPHTEGGPQILFGLPGVAPLVKKGDRLFGSASVICPECTRGRTYIVYMVFGQGGWFSEIDSVSSGVPISPRNFSRDTRESYFKEIEGMAPPQSRIPIEMP